MSDKDETIPVSSDQNTKPKMSLATNNVERRTNFHVNSKHGSFANDSTANKSTKSEKPKDKK